MVAFQWKVFREENGRGWAGSGGRACKGIRPFGALCMVSDIGAKACLNFLQCVTSEDYSVNFKSSRVK